MSDTLRTTIDDAHHPLAGAARGHLRERGIQNPAHRDFDPDDYCTALGLIYRRALECRYASESKKQHTVAQDATAFMRAAEEWASNEVRGRLSTTRSNDDAYAACSKRPPVNPLNQPYVAAILKFFAPSLARMGALARALRLPPSVAALMAETFLHANSGTMPSCADRTNQSSKAIYDCLIEKLGPAGDVSEIFAPWVAGQKDGEGPVYAEYAPGLAAALREWRERRKMSQSVLSRLLRDNGSRATQDFGTAVSQVERYEYSPSWPKLFIFTRSFGIPLSELFFESERQALRLVRPPDDSAAAMASELTKMLSLQNVKISPEIQSSVEHFLQTHAANVMAFRAAKGVRR